MSLANQFSAYADWRTQLSAHLGALQDWLSRNELSDEQTPLRLAQLRALLADDRLTVAFVAEFSRGKSELINAIFFGEYGSRILPSSAGRTTMCPTELLYDAGKPPQLELLPIATRRSELAVSEFKRRPDDWVVEAFDIASPEAMQAALRHVSETTRVAPDEAAALGFTLGDENNDLYRIGDDGLVEVPRWRHALINFPHPLLQQGLVILDTPGLNAIGAEPELTLSLLPNAHAVLFVLAADTGVSQSDLAIWQDHLGDVGLPRRGRLVVLNKIDAQWDELKTPAEVEAEIARQVEQCAATLALPATQIYPVSAQKALVARINGDEALLARSRLPALEAALSQALVPVRREILAERIDRECSDLAHRVNALLDARRLALSEQLGELGELRGKNRGVVEYMLGRIRSEKEEFEAGLQRYYAVRSVFSTLSNNLFVHLGLDTLRQLTHETRTSMLDASFSRTLSEAMAAFFAQARAALTASNEEIAEILKMMEAIYRKFSVEHGLKLGAPTSFSLQRYEQEIDRLQTWCDSHLNTMLTLLTRDKQNITQRFFEEVAIQVRRAFEQANKDVEIWLRAIMVPMETQVREHQAQFKRRLESVRRIHQATDSLEARIGELSEIEQRLSEQTQTLATQIESLRGQLTGAA